MQNVFVLTIVTDCKTKTRTHKAKLLKLLKWFQWNTTYINRKFNENKTFFLVVHMIMILSISATFVWRKKKNHPKASEAFELITTHYFQLRSILLRLIAHNVRVVWNVCTVVKKKRRKNELTQNQTHGKVYKWISFLFFFYDLRVRAVCLYAFNSTQQ